MFLKMLKYEFRAMFRALLPLFGGLLLGGLVTRFCIWMEDRTDASALQVFGILIITIFFIGCAAAVVLTAVLSVVRFARTVHGDEGYLTNTLPVSVHTILLSRVLVSLVSLILAAGVVVLSVMICTFHLSDVKDLGKLIMELLHRMNLETGTLAIRIVLTALTALMTLILELFAAISIGHSFANRKVGMSVLFVFVLYIARQIISSIVLTALMGGSIVMITMEDTAKWMWGIIALEAGLSLVFYFLNWVMIKKRLNLA